MKRSIITTKNNRRNQIIVLCIWIFIWQMVSVYLNNEILLPTPVSTVVSLQKRMTEFVFWKAIFFSLYKITLGYLIAWLLGILSACISYKNRYIRQFFSPFINIVKAIPIASFIILILVWVTSANLSTWISFLVVFPIIYISVLEGLDQIDKELIEMTKVFRIPLMRKIRYVYSSEVLPFLITGSKTALGMCWKSGISAEIIGLPKNSIGEQLYFSKIYLNISDLFAWTIVIILLSYVFEQVFLKLLNVVEKKWIS